MKNDKQRGRLKCANHHWPDMCDFVDHSFVSDTTRNKESLILSPVIKLLTLSVPQVREYICGVVEHSKRTAEEKQKTTEQNAKNLEKASKVLDEVLDERREEQFITKQLNELKAVIEEFSDTLKNTLKDTIRTMTIECNDLNFQKVIQEISIRLEGTLKSSIVDFISVFEGALRTRLDRQRQDILSRLGGLTETFAWSGVTSPMVLCALIEMSLWV